LVKIACADPSAVRSAEKLVVGIADSARPVVVEVPVPDGMSSVILGKGGRAIQTLQRETNTRLTLLRGSAVLRVEGRHEYVEVATARVGEILSANGCERVEIESSLASILIGQGGKTILALERDFGVEITVIKGSSSSSSNGEGGGGGGGSKDSSPSLVVSVQIVGPKDQVAKARTQVLHVVGQSDRKLLFRVEKRQHLGIIVGQGGRTIAQLMQDHGVKIDVLESQNAVMIEEADGGGGGGGGGGGDGTEGSSSSHMEEDATDPSAAKTQPPKPSGECEPAKQHGGGGVYRAKRAIEQLLREQVRETEVILIPERRVAAVIGAGGKTIADIQSKSKAQVTVEPVVKRAIRSARPEDAGGEEVKVEITGNPAQIRDARLRIEELCAEFAEELPLPHPSIAGVIIGKGGKVCEVSYSLRLLCVVCCVLCVCVCVCVCVCCCCCCCCCCLSVSQ
jgi:hypothetical protein